MKMARALGVFAFTGALLVGCGSAGEPPAGPQPRGAQLPDAPAGDAPAFEGSWSDLFTSVYSSATTTDEQRVILSDGVITDAEYAQLRGEFQQCLEDLGLEAELHPDGGFTIDEGSSLSEAQIAEDAVPVCEQKTVGSVVLLYEQIRRNPDQRDEATIVVECLKRDGVVGSSYSPADYQRDLDAYRGLDWASDAVRSCSQDPLGLLDGTAADPSE